MQRYRLSLQRVDHQEPEWGHLHHANLSYCPLDLYSGHHDRITRALTAMAHNPQNFLHIYVNSGTYLLLKLLLLPWLLADDKGSPFPLSTDVITSWVL